MPSCEQWALMHHLYCSSAYGGEETVFQRASKLRCNLFFQVNKNHRVSWSETRSDETCRESTWNSSNRCLVNRVRVNNPINCNLTCDLLSKRIQLPDRCLTNNLPSRLKWLTRTLMMQRKRWKRKSKKWFYFIFLHPFQVNQSLDLLTVIMMVKCNDKHKQRKQLTMITLTNSKSRAKVCVFFLATPQQGMNVCVLMLNTFVFTSLVIRISVKITDTFSFFPSTD